MVLCGFFLIHLVGAYIYSDGKYIGLPGGSVSVGVVSDSRPQPLNPLLYGHGKIDDTIYNMLFRSLIRYNSEKEIYEWDLANCDITNLKKIICILRDDAFWSDGTNINSDDIIATINLFKEKAGLQSIKTALSSVNIKIEDKNIIIESAGNSAIIEALSYPILRTDVIDQLKNNRLKKESYITSGPFIYEEATDDSEQNYHSIILSKNPNYKGEVWLDKFRFRIFPDVASLQRGVNTAEIIIPPLTQSNLNLGASMKEIEYSNYEFYGNFFNTNRLDPNLRAILLKHLALKLKESSPKVTDQTPVNSIFHNGTEISGKEELTINLIDFMADKGYKKKSSWIADVNSESTTLTSGGSIPKLKYFWNGGGYSILYSDDPKAEISLFGKIPSTTTSVTINNYTLREYSAGSTQFVYKISSEAGTLKNGKNTYELKLAQKDGSTLTETLTIYHTLNAEQMNTYKWEVEQNLLAELNTPEKIAERENSKQEKLTKIEALDPSLYYNANYEPFSLKLAYIAEKEVGNIYTEFTASALKEMGISVELNPLEAKALDAMIKSGEKNYDMIIVGVRSPGTIADLGTAFFSSEKGNPNFANISSKNFVNLFEQLKNTPDPEHATELKNKIINFMNQENFYLPISQPIHKFYMHMDVKWMKMPKIIDNHSSLAFVFDTLSKREDYEKNTEWKNISGFFSWFGSQLSSKTENK